MKDLRLFIIADFLAGIVHSLHVCTGLAIVCSSPAILCVYSVCTGLVILCLSAQPTPPPFSCLSIAATFAHLAERALLQKLWGFKFLSIPTGSSCIILDSIAKEILGLNPGLEKSIAGGKSRGKTHLRIAFGKNFEIFRKLAFMNSASGEVV
jgi:hypothetical protein